MPEIPKTVRQRWVDVKFHTKEKRLGMGYDEAEVGGQVVAM